MSDAFIVRRGAGTGKAYAILQVKYPAGITCTCTNGYKTLKTKDTSGNAIFYIPRPPKWQYIKTTTGTDLSARYYNPTIVTSGATTSTQLLYTDEIRCEARNTRNIEADTVFTYSDVASVNLIETDEPFAIIAQPPASIDIERGQRLFVGVATNKGAGVTYQWQTSKDGDAWSNSTISSAATATYTTELTATTTIQYLRCKIVYAGQTYYSNVTYYNIVTNANQPVFYASPQTQNAKAGEPAVFAFSLVTTKYDSVITPRWQYKSTLYSDIWTVNLSNGISYSIKVEEGNTYSVDLYDLYPEYVYTGESELITDPNDLTNWKLKLLTSGNLQFLNNKGIDSIDVFLVGGGGGGFGRRSGGAGGGGGGYTKTISKSDFWKSYKTKYPVKIGAGGTGTTSSTAAAVGDETTAFEATANGGDAGMASSRGGNGGSGGGSYTGEAGASDGANAGHADTTVPYGCGQGTTTREFGESDGTLYAGGGGAGGSGTAHGGAGGGGDGINYNPNNMNGEPNTGGGGGGGNQSNNGGNGGSGIVIIRNHRT